MPERDNQRLLRQVMPLQNAEMNASAKPPDNKPRWVRLLGGMVIGILVGAALVFLINPKTAQDALNRGRYEAARSYLLIDAEQGDAGAQNLLGNLHRLRIPGTNSESQSAVFVVK